MKKTFIVANWKSNKTTLEAASWFQEISLAKQDLGSLENTENKEIIICPSYTLLPLVNDLIKQYQLPFKIGAQDISPFDEGAFTGAINGKQLKEFCDYVLVGHSERRKYFGETFEILEKKVNQCETHDMQPIFLAQDENDLIPHNVSLITYEPPSSISPGPADTPENAEMVAKKMKEKNPDFSILYGGNVIAENCGGFLHAADLSGVLIGRASLSPQEFFSIIKHA